MASEATGANGARSAGSRGQQPRGEEAERDADQEPEPELADEQDGEVLDAVAGLLDPRDQPGRQRDGHRVVGARLGVQQRREPPTQRREAQRREHGRRVGRADDGAEQERLAR